MRTRPRPSDNVARLGGVQGMKPARKECTCCGYIVEHVKWDAAFWRLSLKRPAWLWPQWRSMLNGEREKLAKRVLVC